MGTLLAEHANMIRRFLSGVVLVVVCVAGCSDTKAPPIVIGDTAEFAGTSTPLFADGTALYFNYAGAGETDGVYKLDLVSRESTLLIPGAASRVRRQGDTLIAIVRSNAPVLATIPLDGSAVTTEPLPGNDVVSWVVSGGYTFVMQAPTSDNGRMRLVRLATESEPELTLLDVERSFVSDDVLYATDGYLYWLEYYGSQLYRIADDGSENEAAYIWQSTGVEIELSGQVNESEDQMIGVIGQTVYALSSYTSFFATGGEWSNGDPKGYDGFGGGAIYTLDGESEAKQFVLGDVRAATVTDGTIVGQNLDLRIMSFDPQTNTVTKFPGYAHALDGNTALVASSDTLYYRAYDREEERTKVYAFPLTP